MNKLGGFIWAIISFIIDYTKMKEFWIVVFLLVFFSIGTKLLAFVLSHDITFII